MTDGTYKKMTLGDDNVQVQSAVEDGDKNTISATYSKLTHNHDSTYSKTTHNHDSTYSKLNHNHDGTYISKITGSNGLNSSTSSGETTIAAALQDTTKYSTAGTRGTASSRLYAVGLDSSGNLAVNVPWTDTAPTTYTTGVGLTANGTQFKAKLKAETASTLDSAAMGSTSGRQYAVGVDKSGYLTVNIPWIDTDTKVTQAYSATNNYYPVLLCATPGTSSTSSRGETTSILNNDIYANPSEGAIYAKDLYSNGTKVSTEGHNHNGTYLPLSGGTLTGALTGTTATFTSLNIPYDSSKNSYISHNNNRFTISYCNDEPIRIIRSGVTGELLDTTSSTQTVTGEKIFSSFRAAQIWLGSTSGERSTDTHGCINYSNSNIYFATPSGGKVGVYDSTSAMVKEFINVSDTQTITGQKTFTASNVILGSSSSKTSLTINGDITVNGSAYETHAQKIYTTNDYITMREGATGALTGYSGFQVTKYDGTNDGRLVIDSTGTARVGDVDDEQPLMTRSESSSMTDGQILKWDGTNYKAVTSGYTIATSVPSGALFTDTKNTAGSTNTLSKIFLIGATSQANNPQTYSHDTAYVGTDGCLYSNNTKVSVESHTHDISLVSGGTSTITLAHDTAYTLTAGGSSVVFKTPADNNTDTRVTQAPSTTDDTYPILACVTANKTTASRSTTIFGTGIKLNPKTSTITATTFSGDATGYTSDGAIATALAEKSDTTHTHDISLVSGGTSTITLAHNTAYTLTAGGSSVVFKTPADSDTDKKTASTASTDTKLFLVGAAAQSSNGQDTKSNVNCYVGTDNCLYSGGSKVLTAHQTLPTLSVSTSGSGNAVTAISVSDHAITATKGATFLTEHQTLPELSITTTGSGNAITAISVDDHAITATKGATFLTSHQSLSAYATLANVNQRIDFATLSNGTTATTTKGYTYGVAGGGTATASYYSARWIVNLKNGNTTLTDGMMITIKVPVAGSWSYGVLLSINGNTDANLHPVCRNTNGWIGDRYPVNSVITLVYNSVQTSTAYPATGASAATTYTGIWVVVNDTDSDTNTRVTQAPSTTDATYPILACVTANQTAASRSTTIFGTGIKLNPKTSTITATTFSGALSGSATSAGKWTTARNISISDSDGTNTGTAVAVDGSEAATLLLPATIKASITGNCSGSSGSCTGNAATATKATKDASGNTITSTYATNTNVNQRIDFATLSNGTTATTTKGYTYGVAGGGTATASYYSARWIVNLKNGNTTLTDGMMITIKVPVAGSWSYGVLLSINGNTDANLHPVCRYTNWWIGERYPVDSVITLVYNSVQTSTAYPATGASAATTYTGIWVVVNDTDSDTDIKVRQTTLGGSDDVNRSLLLSYVVSTTTGNTDNITYRSTKIHANDNTGTITASIFSGDATGYTSDGAIATALAGKAASSHSQAASTITAGTLAGAVVANATAVTSYTTKQVRNIIISTADPTSSDGANGDIWFKYSA